MRSVVFGCVAAHMFALSVTLGGVVTPHARAQTSNEVMYCTESKSVGFQFDEKLRDYRQATFQENRYTIAWLDGGSRAKLTISGKRGHAFSLQCKLSVSGFWHCTSEIGYGFNYNPKTRDFVKYSALGPLAGGLEWRDAPIHDSISISLGTCTAF